MSGNPGDDPPIDLFRGTSSFPETRLSIEPTARRCVGPNKATPKRGIICLWFVLRAATEIAFDSVPLHTVPKHTYRLASSTDKAAIITQFRIVSQRKACIEKEQ